MHGRLKPGITSLAVAACFSAGPAASNPTGPIVVNGTASFQQHANVLQITNSPNAIINWQGFSIGAGETTKFIQQSAASAVLNRVTSQNPSAILGALQSNGRVFVINPNGIVFGPGAQINVSGLVASTLNLTDADFLAGRLRFGATPAAGALVNQGNLSTTTGGSVYLVAPDVTNTGIITSPKGEVLLLAGKSAELIDPGTPNLRVELTAPDNKALNVGQVLADSGRVGIYAGLINQKGTVRADNVVVGDNGRILLQATKRLELEKGSTTQAGSVTLSAGENIVAAGTVRAQGKAAVSAPGAVMDINGGQIVAPQIDIDAWSVLGQGTIDASGASGGAVHIDTRYLSFDGGIRADGRAGNGGAIDVHAGQRIMLNSNSAVTANGTASGGTVSLTGDSGFMLLSGQIATEGKTGGTIALTAPNVTLFGAKVSTNGETAGGKILLGGEWQGSGILPWAGKVYVDERSVLSADATKAGNGGTVVAWSRERTDFGGTATARGGVRSGDGGNIEISSKDAMTLWSAPNASARAAGGKAGNVLLDPKNIVVDEGGDVGLIIFRSLFGPGSGAAPSTVDTGDHFGEAVAISGTTAVIGAPFDATRAGSGTESGNAYIFNTATNAWTDLSAAGLARPLTWGAGDRFGTSVAVSGNQVLIGSPRDATRGFYAGNAYLFNNNTSVWTDLSASLTAPATWNTRSWFGAAVALSGNLALIGAPINSTRDAANGDEAGNAYLLNTATGVWTDLSAGNQRPGSWTAHDNFGSAVALEGTLGLIGSPADATRGAGAGNAYLYNTGSGALTDLNTLGTRPASWTTGAGFGASVAVSGTQNLIGAPFSSARGSQSGNAYIFNTTGSVWSDLAASPGTLPATWTAGALFGQAVALAGNLAVIGAPAAEARGEAESGNAYLFDTSAKSWTDLSTTSPPATWLNLDRVGTSVAISGRLAIIGAPQNTLGGTNSGNAFLVQFDPASAAGGLTFTADPTTTRTIAPALITAITNSGSNVTLQANNDITVNQAILTSNNGGNGGSITMQAGRSILVNANIATDNGALTLVGNETAANGVQNANRDAGNAVISMAGGTALDAGTGNVSITLRDGAGLSNRASGAVTLQSVKGGTIAVANNGPTTGSGIVFGDAVIAANTLTAAAANGDITLNAGSHLTSGAAGYSLVLAGLNFVNGAGASPFSTGSGRFLVYSTAPGANTFGGFASPGNLFGRTYAANPPASINAATFGNRMVYTVSPVLNVTADAKTKVYGDADPALTFTTSGLVAGDTAASTLSGALARTAGENVADGPYAITQGSVAERLGYTLQYNSANLAITRAPLTIRADDKSKLQGTENPPFTVTYTGFKRSDTPLVVSGLAITSPATAASPEGTYPIIPSGATASNYAIAFVNGTLTVTLVTPPPPPPPPPLCHHGNGLCKGHNNDPGNGNAFGHDSDHAGLGSIK
jgi:filamentous hemagglutinin family protein